jgi:hypothetical protein
MMTCTVLDEGRWMDQAKRHRLRLEPHVLPALARKSRQEKHPVYDFLFEYYSFRPGSLLRWSPRPGVLLAGPCAAGPAFAGRKGFVRLQRRLAERAQPIRARVLAAYRTLLETFE